MVLSIIMFFISKLYIFKIKLILYKYIVKYFHTLGVMVDILLLKQYVYFPVICAENVYFPFVSRDPSYITLPSGSVIRKSMSKNPPSAISNVRPEERK